MKIGDIVNIKPIRTIGGDLLQGEGRIISIDSKYSLNNVYVVALNKNFGIAEYELEPVNCSIGLKYHRYRWEKFRNWACWDEYEQKWLGR